ncbi:MAG: pseudouridylate synthase [Deltaproteobacteria bacterium]|nr:pseudouridylate synthase [Deltaproteobacteria bacterium]
MDLDRTEWSAPVLYRDDNVLVVDKPSGLLVHRGWADDPVTLVDLVRQLVGGGKVFPAHRLDRGCSGAVLFALDAETARSISASIGGGEITKHYLALVRGEPPASGTIDHPLPRREGGPVVSARTDFRLLHTVKTEPRHVSLVRATTRSGRLHQVRRHLKHLSHPLIGDANYGKGPLNRALRERYGLARLSLHAVAIELPHPRDASRLEVRAPLPEDLAAPLYRMGFPDDVLLDAQR